MDLALHKKVIKDFDLYSKNSIHHKDPHIYLLPQSAFENQAPNYQLKKHLDQELQNKRVKLELQSKFSKLEKSNRQTSRPEYK